MQGVAVERAEFVAAVKMEIVPKRAILHVPRR
jgi:hypothetical protein